MVLFRARSGTTITMRLVRVASLVPFSVNLRNCLLNVGLRFRIGLKKRCSGTACGLDIAPERHYYRNRTGIIL